MSLKAYPGIRNTMTDKLFFYKKSANKPTGLGAHDVVQDPTIYTELNAIPDWRKKIDEYYVAPFTYQGVKYNTVMHMVFAQKSNLADPDYAWQFTLDSGSPLSKLDYKVFEHKNDVKLNAQQEQEWKTIGDDILYEGNHAKFDQHPDLKAALLATHSAELWSTPDRFLPASRRTILEELRRDLQ